MSSGAPARPARWARSASSARSATWAWGFIAVAVLGISSSAPVSVAVAAPVLAVAFWRNAVGALASGVWTRVSDPAGLRRLDRRGWVLAVLAGLFLAVHFWLWLTGLRLTSVTASTALAATAPVWVIGFQLLRGERVPRVVLAGVGLAIVGTLAITGVDAARSGRALAGDLLSVASAVAVTGYLVSGQRVMRQASAPVYTLVAYSACALSLLPVALLSHAALTGFSVRAWVELGVIALGAQLLGHTMLNAALPVIGATAVSLAVLLETPGAAVVAWVWLGQDPPLTVIPGTVLMLLGLVVVARAGAPDPGPDVAVIGGAE